MKRGSAVLALIAALFLVGCQPYTIHLKVTYKGRPHQNHSKFPRVWRRDRVTP